MSELIEPTEPTEPIVPPVEPNIADVMAALEQLKVVPPAAEPVPVTAAPAPAPPPQAPPSAPVGGRVTRKQYDDMQAYAAQQAQRAEKLVLAQEFGLSEQDLEGDFESPADMRRHAEVLSLRQQLKELEVQMQVQRATLPGTPPSVPAADAGGPTSLIPTTVAELQGQYDAARALGQTAKGRRALLAAIYRDPTKRRAHIIRDV